MEETVRVADRIFDIFEVLSTSSSSLGLSGSPCIQKLFQQSL
jgi:hypothetical protein